MMGIKTDWLKISLVNLLIVSMIGVIMRYKIGFELLFFDQKHLQTAHSNFAFSGWISQTLMVLLCLLIKDQISKERAAIYDKVFAANLLFAYGMLFSFTFQGYGMFSIVFSIGSVIVSYLFAILFFRDIRNSPLLEVRCWFQAALLFNLLSSFGGFALNLMMATKSIKQHLYLAAVYWYLHFQYNGWFFFACMGLFFVYIQKKHPSFRLTKKMFWLFGASCIPAYGLSVLWADLPVIVYVVVVFSAIAQAVGWFEIFRQLKNHSFFKTDPINKLGSLLLYLSLFSLTIKLSLQLGSTIPAISKLAFGFRPIVIAYLHLVLLAFTSVFLMGYICSNRLIAMNKATEVGLGIFIIGVFLNEIVLAIQGVFSLDYMVVPNVNLILLWISVFMFIGLSILFYSQMGSQVNRIKDM